MAVFISSENELVAIGDTAEPESALQHTVGWASADREVTRGGPFQSSSVRPRPPEPAFYEQQPDAWPGQVAIAADDGHSSG